MNLHSIFVSEFFLLGPKLWLEKYSNKIPANMTPSAFADEIRNQGLELRFVDKPNWTQSMKTDLPCYLIAEDDGRYGIYMNDMGHIVNEGMFEKLSDAIEFKAKMLLLILSIPSPKKS